MQNVDMLVRHSVFGMTLLSKCEWSRAKRTKRCEAMWEEIFHTALGGSDKDPLLLVTVLYRVQLKFCYGTKDNIETK